MGCPVHRADPRGHGPVAVLAATLGVTQDKPLELLCLGAHSDDIEIGCGGTVLRLLAEHPETRVRWVIFSANAEREEEARRSAEDFLAGAGTAEITVHRFPESYFPAAAAEIKGAFEQLRERASPDVVFTHRQDDRHQDHRVLGELTWNTFRDHLILEYEIPKYEGDLGHPNFFVPIESATADRKIGLLMAHFATQRNKRWFRPETFRAMLALRAVECNAPDGWAEAFHVRKLVLGR